MGFGFIRSAQVLEEVRSKCHTLCLAIGGGGSQLLEQEPTHWTVCTHLLQLSTPRHLAASPDKQKAAQPPPSVSAQGSALSCSLWDGPGK